MKRVLISLTAAFVFAGTMIAAPVTSMAAGLTETTDASAVSYGTLTDAQKAAVRTIFDYEYYKEQNPELVALLGDSFEALFSHFCNYGIFEGKTCNNYFDPSAYAALNSDLAKAYGNDIVAYYVHYVGGGKDEPRPAPTLATCYEKGVSVTSLADSSIVITPDIYSASKTLGVNNYKAAQNLAKAVHQAAASGGSVVIERNEENNNEEAGYEFIVVDNEQVNPAPAEPEGENPAPAAPEEGNGGDNPAPAPVNPVIDGDALARAKSLEKVAVVSAQNSTLVNLYVVRGQDNNRSYGAAIYKYDTTEENLVVQTDDYVRHDEDTNLNENGWIIKRITNRVSVINENHPAAWQVDAGTVLVQSYSGEFEDHTASEIPDHVYVTDDNTENNPCYYNAIDNSLKVATFDSSGEENTHYQVTAGIEKTDEGLFNVTVGVYSVEASEDENGDGEPDEVVSTDDFGYVAEFDNVEERELE
jgi:hypothetical protein